MGKRAPANVKAKMLRIEQQAAIVWVYLYLFYFKTTVQVTRVIWNLAPNELCMRDIQTIDDRMTLTTDLSTTKVCEVSVSTKFQNSFRSSVIADFMPEHCET